MNKEKQKEKKKTTSFATSFRAIVTGFWCHHQPWHFIHTEHLWAHHICFSTQRIFKCFPGNCFNTICLLGNPVPTNAMPLSLFLGLLILAYKNPVARFSICSYSGTDLSLHVKREGWMEKMSCALDSGHYHTQALVSYQRKRVSKLLTEKTMSPTTKIRESLQNHLHSSDFLRNTTEPSQSETACHLWSPDHARGSITQHS